MNVRMRGDVTATANAATPVDRGTMSSGQWHPTVAYLLALVIAEIAFFGVMRYVFRTAHGG